MPYIIKVEFGDFRKPLELVVPHVVELVFKCILYNQWFCILLSNVFSLHCQRNLERRRGKSKTSKNDSWSRSDIKVFYAVVNKSRVDLIEAF